MNLRNPDAANAEPKTLKVRVPVQQHIQLRTLKVLTGKSMSDAVAEALNEYFTDLRADDAATAAAESVAQDHLQEAGTS